MAGSDQSIVDALYRISRVVNETDDPREALESIIDAIMDVLPAGSAAIELINPNTARLEIEVYRGFQKSAADTSLRIGQGVTGWVALHGIPLYVPDVREDFRYVELDPHIRSELAVPLRLEDGSILGVVNIDSTQIDAFDANDQKILSVLAGEATRALNRIWLIQQLRLKADHLQALIETGRSVVSKRNIEEILTVITRQSLEIIDSKISAIFLLDKDQEHLVLRAVSGSADLQDYSERLALDDSAIGTAIRRQKSIEIYDLPKTEEHHFLPIVQSEGLVSLLACPIVFENEAIGVLNVYTDHSHRFHNEEKKLCEALASLGAVAIQNARLYDRIFASEENLRKTEQLTTLGLLSAEIAHEIRNPLTVIRLLFESLTLDFAPNDARSRDVSIINEKLDQLEAIVTRVLSFGKSNYDLRSPYNLNDLISDTLHLVRLKLKQQKIDLVFTQHNSEPLRVEVHKGQMQQAILNLLLNATQAMSDGGNISISTTTEELNNNRFAVIRITDSGDGIPREIRDKVFDSFLTSRPEGTGLGLAIVKRILKSHHGDIIIEDSSPSGTTMKLSLALSHSR